MDIEWKETYEILKKKHDEVVQTVELAKQNEENENKDVALINYKLSITLIDEALATPVALPDDPNDVDDTWQSGLKIVKMLKRTRGEVLHRIAILQPSTSQSNVSKMPSEQSNGAQTRPRTFMELAEALQNLEFNFMDPMKLPKVLELLFSCQGVKLYHINVNGEVTTTDESSTLRIVRLDRDVTQNFDATYFMQIIRSSAVEEIQIDDVENEDAELDNAIENDDDDDIEVLDEKPLAKKVRENSPTKVVDTSLIYPLVPGVSPCFRTEFGAFIFPDIQSDEQGAAIGIVIPRSTDAIVYEILEAILHGIVRQSQEGEEEDEEEEEEESKRRARRHTSERISDGIVQGSCFISNSLVKGSEQFGKLVSYTTPYIISKISRAPENAPPVSNKVANGIEIAKTATGVAVGVTSYLAGKVGSASVALGKFIAPHVHAQGSKILSKSMGYSTDEAKDKVCIKNVRTHTSAHKVFNF